MLRSVCKWKYEPMPTAFLLAAGFGTRLRPFTECVPKPLVPVCGVPMLDYVMSHCSAYGLTDVVVNAHHLPEQIYRWADDRRTSDVRITVSNEQPDILGTGGGLKNVAAHLSSEIVVLNGDVLTDVDLSQMVNGVPDDGAIMVLRPNEYDATHRYGIVATDEENCVIDLKKMALAEPVGTTRWDSHFTGIHALKKSVLGRVPDGFGCIVRTAYIELVPMRRIAATHHDGIWLDVGDPKAYLETNLAVLRGDVRLHLDPSEKAAVFTRTGQSIPDSDVRVIGALWVGHDVNWGQDIQCRDSVIGDGAILSDGVDLEECVVWSHATVPKGTWKRCVFYGDEMMSIDESGIQGASE